MQKWVSYNEQLIEKKTTFNVEFNIELEHIKYSISCIIGYVNRTLEKLKIIEATYEDPIGKFKLDEKSTRKLNKLVKRHLIGYPEDGLLFNRPFKTLLSDFIPQPEKLEIQTKE